MIGKPIEEYTCNRISLVDKLNVITNFFNFDNLVIFQVFVPNFAHFTLGFVHKHCKIILIS